MKKLVSLSDNVGFKLEAVAKEQNTTQSKLVETAIVIYMMMYFGAPDQAKILTDLIPKNQMSMFDILEKKK